jgi:hypothetical protein
MNPRARVKVEEIDSFVRKYHGQMKIRPGVHPVFQYEPGMVPRKDLPEKINEVISGIKQLLES